MKVKNIMFAGFASAILSGVCGAASAADYNLVTEGYVTEKLAGKADAGASYTKAEANALLENKADASYVGTIPEGANVENVVAYVEKKTAGIASEGAMETLSGRVDAVEGDIETLQTAMTGEGEGSVAQKISTALTGYATEGFVTEELGDYALKSELPTVPTNVSAFNNDAGYLTTATADELYDAAGAAAAVDAKLSNYATTEAMNTALQDKQDVIENLATIEANAAKGATAVQPEALTQTLDSYATTEEMNTALQGKQATIENLNTIIAGAEAGAKAVQPGANVSVLVNDSNFQTAENVNTLIGQAQIAESQVTGLTDALAGKLDDTMTEAGTYLVQRAGDGTISYVSVEIVEETSAQE